MNIVFFHVGVDVELPTMMVRSALIQNPKVKVYQCTDFETQMIEGVHQVIRGQVDLKNLMYSRMRAFSTAGIDQVAVYVDTDYLWVQDIRPEVILGDLDVILCARSYDFHEPFNTSFRGLDFSEYEGQSLGEAFPFLGCFAISKSTEFWRSALEVYGTLGHSQLAWYGDQEVIKRMAAGASGCEFRIGSLPESMLARLPERDQEAEAPIGYHFKGEKRKATMRSLFGELLTLSEFS